ncbi:MAG: hypothetical protein Q7T03_02690 [Deltaproteobacteria bacterium]|nr:hypothetical protein [Deltaproteobacteria bacterium]
MKKLLAVLGTVMMVWAILGIGREAQAVSQWARKYKVNCQTCHTAFPRLTYFGEKFQRNGYQMPDTEDGDEVGKEKIGDNLFIDVVNDFFGARMSVSPATITTNGLKEHNAEGTLRTKLSFGTTDWLQFFTAGSVFKDASIFIETEIGNTSIKNNWFYLTYNNILKGEGFGNLLNLRVGKLSVLNWFPQSGRLRMIPNINIEGLNNVKSSGGAPTTVTVQDQVNFSSPEAGLELFGYKGPFLYSAGVTNGAGITDDNQFKNVFGTLRMETTGGPIEGSSVAGSGYWGTNTGYTGLSTRKDRFWRWGAAANLRYKKWDVIGSYFFQHDNNWTLASTGPLVNKSKILSGQVGYLIDPLWFAALQYDYVTDSFKNSTTVNSNYYNKVSPSIWYMPRENMRIGFVNRWELRGRPGGRQQEFLFNVRFML